MALTLAFFAAAFVGLLGNPHVLGEAVHITSDELLTWNQIFETVARAAGAEADIVHLDMDPEPAEETIELRLQVSVRDQAGALGALAALHERERTGRGRHIDAALLDTQVAMLANQASNQLIGGKTPQRMGNAHPNIVPYQVFETADRPLCLAAGNDRLWARCAKALGHPEWGAEARFATGPQRVRNKGELIPLIQAALRERTRAEWLDALAATDAIIVPGGGPFGVQFIPKPLQGWLGTGTPRNAHSGPHPSRTS